MHGKAEAFHCINTPHLISGFNDVQPEREAAFGIDECDETNKLPCERIKER